MKTITRPPVPRRVPRRMVKTLHARAATSDKDFEEYESESEPNMKFSHALLVVLLLHILAVGGVFAFNTLKSRHIVPDRTKPATADQATATPTPDVFTGPAGKTSTAAQTKENGSHIATAPEKAPAKAETGVTTYIVAAGDTLRRIATAHKSSVEAIEEANGISSTTAIRVGQALKIPASKSTAAPVKTTAKPEPAVVSKTTESKAVPTVKPTETKPATVAKTTETKPIAAKATETVNTAKPAADPAPAESAKPATGEKTYTVTKGDNPYSIAKKLKVSYNELIKANNITDPTKLQIGQTLKVP